MIAAKQAVQRLGVFFREVREEMGRVSWPTRDELLGSAVVVFVGVAVLASYLAVVDLILSKTVRLFLQ